MQRDVEKAAQANQEALVLRQKRAPLQVTGEDSVLVLQKLPYLRQWRVQQLQRLAEELRAEWQVARQQKVRNLEQLYSAHLLNGMAGLVAGMKEPVQQRSPRAKERHRAGLRGEAGSRREELPRQQGQRPKTRKKTTGSERPGSARPRARPRARAQALSPSEKGKGKRGPSRKTNGGRRPVTPRVGRWMEEKLNPIFALAGEITCQGEMQKERAPEGKRQLDRVTAPFSGRNIAQDQSPEGTVDDPEEPSPAGSADQKETESSMSLCKGGDKSKWQKELEFAFEELFNTNRKLKKHLSLHLESRSRMEQNPDKEAAFSDTHGGARSEGRAEEAGTMPAGEYRSPKEEQAPQTSSFIDLERLLSKVEEPKYYPMAKPTLRNESQPWLSLDAGRTVNGDDFLLQSPKTGSESFKTATLAEGLPLPPAP